MKILSFLSPRFMAVAAVVLAFAGTWAPANAGQIFNLTASNTSFDIPSPLFTSSQIDGFLVIADSVAPGGSFGAGQLEQFSFNIAGYHLTQVNLDPSFNSIDVDGRISADGMFIHRYWT